MWCYYVFSKIRRLKNRRDKTQEEIAKVLNCRREVYRRYEKGIFEIPVWALIRLADYYNTSTDYILGRTDEIRPYRSKNRRS